MTSKNIAVIGECMIELSQKVPTLAGALAVIR